MVSRQHLTFPRVMMAACEACRRVSPDARQDAEGARGRRGNATNDSDADIGDKSYHRFGAVFREHSGCKYCTANIHPETSSLESQYL